MNATVRIPREAVVEYCVHNHIRRLAVFGSALGDAFGPFSDLDLLVEFEPEHIPGFNFFRMERELTEMFGRKVDLNTPGCLSKHFRSRVLAEAEVLFAGA